MATSRMSPERRDKLAEMELEYVQGFQPAGSEERLWPSYAQLSERYGVPLNVIETYGVKHNWVGRREIRRQKWAEKVHADETRRINRLRRMASEQMLRSAMEVWSGYQLVAARHVRAEKLAEQEMQAMLAAGDSLAEAKSKTSPVAWESLARTGRLLQQNVFDALDRMNAEVGAILPAREDDDLLNLDEEGTEGLTQATLSEVMLALEDVRKRERVIAGEVEKDDDAGDRPGAGAPSARPHAKAKRVALHPRGADAEAMGLHPGRTA
jgi:hypothetical protein